jgi:hypothetical protein
MTARARLIARSGISRREASDCFPDPTIMPHVFQLHLLDGRILECELRWARGGFIGVKFRSA